MIPHVGATQRPSRRWICRTAALAATLLLALSSETAMTTEVQHITFDEAVQIALQQNNELKRAVNAVSLDRTAVAEARMSFLPDLRLNISGAESYGRFFSEDEGRLLTETTESFSARLSSSVVLFDGWANVSSLREARLQESASHLDTERTRQTVVFQVVSGYLALIESREQVRIREEDHTAQTEQEQLVRALVDGGKRPISDLYQQQANVAAARLSLVEARRDFELRRVDLVQALQLDPTGEYVFEVPALSEIPEDQPEPLLKNLLERAYHKRPDLKALEAQLEANLNGERVAAAGRWPNVTLSAGYGSNYSSTGQGNFMDQLDRRRTGSVGIGISLPLFDRQMTRHQIQRAGVATENARLALADLHQEVALQVRRAVLDWNAAREGVRAAEAQVQAARQALDATRERYEAGAATLYEVTLSQTDLVSATSMKVSASYYMLWQKRLLDYYVGDLDPSGGLL